MLDSTRKIQTDVHNYVQQIHLWPLVSHQDPWIPVTTLSPLVKIGKKIIEFLSRDGNDIFQEYIKI